MAHNAPRGGNAHPASNYPAPRWTPVTGWRVDPALAYAHALQESNFRASAVSPADARGLMQITPITIREHAPRLAMNAATVDIFDPATNLAFGQRNLEMLRDHPATGGALPKIIAAYNAGLTPVTRWNGEIRDQGDPLLYMESIPYWETREYIASRHPQLLDVRAPGGRRQLGHPRGAGAEPLAQPSPEPRRRRTGPVYERRALMAIDPERTFVPYRHRAAHHLRHSWAGRGQFG